MKTNKADWTCRCVFGTQCEVFVLIISMCFLSVLSQDPLIVHPP